MFTLRFDMRAPSWGAPPAALYAAVPEMCAWAEEHGGLAAVLCEHHGSEDGYLPSPIMLALGDRGANAALALSLILILPFYDPVRLAEDMAVLDIISDGRASYILALGLPARGVRALRRADQDPWPPRRRETCAATATARR